MPELMLPRLIERAATAIDGSLSGVVRTLIAAPATDAERAGERLCVFGAPAGGRLASRRFRVVGERSGREYLTFTLALEDGPESLLEAFLRARPVVDVHPGGRISGRHPHRGAREDVLHSQGVGPIRQPPRWGGGGWCFAPHSGTGQVGVRRGVSGGCG
jgi:hypothetical protein